LDRQEKMQLFMELAGCGGDAWTWCYDENGQLFSSNCPSEALFAAVFRHFGLHRQMLDHAGESDRPVILGNAMGMMWGAAFESGENEVKSAWVIGPVLYTDVSMRMIENGLKAYPEMDVSLRNQIREAVAGIPIVQHTVFSRLLLMLHWCLTGEKLLPSDLQLTRAPMAAPVRQAGERDRHKVWMAERAMMQMVRNGDLNYRQALSTSMQISSGVPVQGSDPLRQSRTSIIVFISLVCRAAMEGGMSPEEAYALGDSYIQSTESARDLSELSAIPINMFDDFVRRVNRIRTDPNLSPHIRRCVEYIEVHLEQKLTAADLARACGYSEYYITRRFKTETGYSFTDYVKFAKIERSKNLLENTERSVQEISDQLGFTNRSYFSRVFREIVGCTPAEFRAQQRKM